MNYSEVKEAELISLSRQGDNSAFDQLIKDNKQKVYLSVLSKKKNPDLAEEITQKAIIKAWKNIDKFQGKSTFYTWVYRISHNLIIDEYRKEQRRKEVSLDERMEEWGGSFEKKLEGVEPQGFENLANEELGETIGEALDRLSPPHKKTLILYEVENLSYKEIAEIMHCSSGTVMSRLFYARRQLRKFLNHSLALDT
ncbi:MAG: RNA polymerase sigma factor [Bacteroidetes bacterium]|nr:RNA polymerase sigma factor [Bacteroidota bacterium]